MSEGTSVATGVFMCAPVPTALVSPSLPPLGVARIRLRADGYMVGSRQCMAHEFC